jgi:XTP/dITP diphosphohydrolase
LKKEADMQELIDFYFVTGNSHKVVEAKTALAPHKIEVKEFKDAEKIEVQSVNLEEIARTALASIVQSTNKLVFVEDSGLFIHELNGFPGPYSSFVFDTLGNEGILKLLSNAGSRRAEYRSSVAFGTKGKILAVFSSVTEGNITAEAKGENGFGFDPIFVPMWTNKTFGQMELKEKTIYSHRAKALSKLALWYLNAAKKKTLEENAILVGNHAESSAKSRTGPSTRNRVKS